MRNGDLLATSFAGSRLKMDLDKIPLWRGDHGEISKLAEDYAQYLYLSRLCDTSVLYGAIRQGLSKLTWRQDSFGYAESYDDDVKRYRGLVCGQQIDISEMNNYGLLVRPEVAEKQIKAETEEIITVSDPETPSSTESEGILEGEGGRPKDEEEGSSTEPRGPKRFYGNVSLDPTRVGRDAGRIAEEVIAHLSGIVDAEVEVTLEIVANIPNGTPEQVVRTVTENSCTLKFEN